MNSKGFFSYIEDKIRQEWTAGNTFEESISQRAINIGSKSNEYVFFDGPPFANGLPHYGHLLTGFVKDVFARYQTIKNKRVERQFGWDCHGLPAELEAEKALGVSGKRDIKAFGIDKFNQQCGESVFTYTKEWREYIEKQGRWVDIDNAYRTLDKDYMESVIWAFKELHNKGLIYKDFRVLPYSWKCQTPLSNFEIRLDNSYRKVQSKSVYLKFKLKTIPEILLNKFGKDLEYFLVAWTTTPWTLPSNLGIAINQNLTYKAYKVSENSVYILCNKFNVDKFEKKSV